MTKLNLGRMVIGGLIATVILFLADGLLHEHLVHQYWEYLYHGLRTEEPAPGSHGVAIAYFLVFELGRGFLAILLYVLMRPFFGIGAKTAIMAAVVAWLAFSVSGPAQFIPLGLYSRRLLLYVGGYQLVTSIVGNLLAAWLYRDPSGAE